MAEITYYLCIFLNLALTIGGTEGNHYSIYRNFSVFGDHFVIPKSLCLNTTTACRKYEALNVGNSMCKCKCPHDKATFSGNGSDWKCVDDKTLRYKTECGVRLMTEIDNQISTLSVRGTSLTGITGLEEIAGDNCDVNMVACQYQFCNGSWLSLKHGTKAPSKFFKVKNLQNGRKFLHVKITPRTLLQHYYGRVIKLAFTPGCRVRGNNGKTCLLIKLQGHVDCKAPKDVLYSSVSPSNSVIRNISPSTETISSQYSGISTASTTYRTSEIMTSSTVSILSTKTIKPSYSSARSSSSIKDEGIYPSKTTIVTKSTVSVNNDNSGSVPQMEDASKELPIIIAAATAGGILILIAFFLVAKFRRST